jgi:hypothetical protein
LFHLSRAASVAILPSALFVSEFSLGASWASSISAGAATCESTLALISESWARTWAQSPELGGELGSFRLNL